MRKAIFWRPFTGIALLLSSPVNAGITTVDFKYTSMAHLGFNGSVVTTPEDPKETLELVANYLRSNGVTVTKIDEGKLRLVQTDGDRACEAWSISIFRAEWAAFARNKLSDYKKIDRTTQPASCSVKKSSWVQYAYSVQAMDTGTSYTVHAIADRPITMSENGTRPSFGTIFNGFRMASVLSMVPTQSTRTVNFQSVFLVHIWKDAETDRTSVFAMGVPKSEGVEAAPGASIGAFYRPYADGGIESTAVGNVLSFVTQKAITRK